MRLEHLLRALRVALILATSVTGAGTPAQGGRQAGEGQAPQWSLEEIRGKRRVFLLAARSQVVDARGPDPSALLEVIGAGKVRAHYYPYSVVARKLNRVHQEAKWDDGGRGPFGGRLHRLLQRA